MDNVQVLKEVNKYTNVINIVSLAFLFFVFVQGCQQSSKNKQMLKMQVRVDSLVSELKRRPVPMTDQQVRDAVRDGSMESMYKYLIYEQDLDKGKTSLSQIRSDIDRLKSKP